MCVCGGGGGGGMRKGEGGMRRSGGIRFFKSPQNITGQFQPNDTHFRAFQNGVAPSLAC